MVTLAEHWKSCFPLLLAHHFFFYRNNIGSQMKIFSASCMWDKALEEEP
jgi:hypothetical protein